ncbi:MAG TPA: hypothetical protein VLH77_04430, partial [Gammaproteobacteria bacterium]|nr:hypothetical protein [Gammaproteobacteria bacterium]
MPRGQQETYDFEDMSDGDLITHTQIRVAMKETLGRNPLLEQEEKGVLDSLSDTLSKAPASDLHARGAMLADFDSHFSKYYTKGQVAKAVAEAKARNVLEDKSAEAKATVVLIPAATILCETLAQYLPDQIDYWKKQQTLRKGTVVLDDQGKKVHVPTGIGEMIKILDPRRDPATLPKEVKKPWFSF